MPANPRVKKYRYYSPKAGRVVSVKGHNRRKKRGYRRNDWAVKGHSRHTMPAKDSSGRFVSGRTVTKYRRKARRKASRKVSRKVSRKASRKASRSKMRRNVPASFFMANEPVAFAMNRRRGGRRRRYFRGSFLANPAAAALGSFKTLISRDNLEAAGAGIVGATVALALPGIIRGVLPQKGKDLLDKWNRGLPGIGISAASVALLAVGANLVPPLRKYAKPLMVGGTIAVGIRAISEFLPQFPLRLAYTGKSGVAGLGASREELIEAATQAANRRLLASGGQGDYPVGLEGVGDVFTGADVSLPQVGDYPVGLEEAMEDEEASSLAEAMSDEDAQSLVAQAE